MDLGLNADALSLTDETWESLKSDARFQKLQEQAAEASRDAAAKAAAHNPKSWFAFYSWRDALLAYRNRARLWKSSRGP